LTVIYLLCNIITIAPRGVAAFLAFCWLVISLGWTAQKVRAAWQKIGRQKFVQVGNQQFIGRFIAREKIGRLTSALRTNF